MDITIGKVLSWFFGVVLLLDGVVIVTRSPVGGVLVALVGVFLLPPVRQWISDEYDIQFSRWVVFIVGIVGIGLFGAFAPGGVSDADTGTNQPVQAPDSNTPSAAQENTSSESVPSEEENTVESERENTVEQRTHEVGESFSVGDIEYRVTDTATRTVIGTSRYYQQEADGIFAIVDLEVTNRAKESVYISDSHLNLVDSQDRQYPAETSVTYYLDDSFSFKRLNPGVTNEGKVVFDVPEDQQGRQLRVQPTDLFSTKEPHFVNLS